MRYLLTSSALWESLDTKNTWSSLPCSTWFCRTGICHSTCIAAVAALASTVNAGLLSASRYPFAMAEQGPAGEPEMPSLDRKYHRSISQRLVASPSFVGTAGVLIPSVDTSLCQLRRCDAKPGSIQQIRGDGPLRIAAAKAIAARSRIKQLNQ